MRLLTFELDGERRVGARAGEAIVDLNRADSSIPADMRGLLEGGEAVLEAARGAVERGESAIAAGDVKVMAPIDDPEKVICIGLNYADHAAETNAEIPPEPVVFSKFASAIIGPGEAVEIPPTSSKVDHEVELVAVIGRGGRNIAEAEGLGHVAGYTVGHDVSARDYQLEKAGGQWLSGKTFDTFAPIGPEIVTPDELSNPHNLGIRCIVNGETRQESNTDQLVFGVGQLVAYLSHMFTLRPGDLIFTGTPGGVGLGREPQVWLRAGDRVVCEIDEIGRLESPFVAG
ncbi:MAG: fumarylacetoacetate hydrolase family protein [Armatimonadota bacterium]|jgi:2-keto-4-pentenoate hydratase/2-oxohepta-3-ene-1,7-dioic acid hydratase in catechol pathway